MGAGGTLLEIYPDRDGLSCCTIKVTSETVYYFVSRKVVFQVLEEASLWFSDVFEFLFTLFSRVSLFAKVSEYVRALAAAIAKKVEVTAGATLVKQSETHQYINVVVSGQV